MYIHPHISRAVAAERQRTLLAEAAREAAARPATEADETAAAVRREPLFRRLRARVAHQGS